MMIIIIIFLVIIVYCIFYSIDKHKRQQEKQNRLREYNERQARLKAIELRIQKEEQRREEIKKYRDELKLEEEEVNKQIELQLQQEERRKQEQLRKFEEKQVQRREHAKKMAEIKKQKKIEREEKARRILELSKKEEEIERKDKIACLIANLAKLAEYRFRAYNDFREIGIISITSFNFNRFAISSKEDINVKRLFTLLNKYNYFGYMSYKHDRLSTIEYIGFLRKRFIRECFIEDLGGNGLIEISLLNTKYEGCCSITLIQESNHIIVFNKGNYEKQAEDFLFCYLENRKIKRLENSLANILVSGIKQLPTLSTDGKTIEERVCSALESSDYGFMFEKQIECIKDSDMLVLDYELPKTSDISKVKEYKYVLSTKEINTKHYSESYLSKRYEDALYSIALRSIYEVFSVDAENEIKGITFNGFVTQVNPATGIAERKCILSIQVDRERFLRINLAQVEPKACFKALKGVSVAKLIDISPVVPILTFNKKDKRFVDSKHVDVSQGTNLAAMHWEDFEQLVRELFEMEFANNGGEVRVTQASRDGGVDAIVFDPDPLRGGKIVIQAKRYTNTVGVSAVRDLYGTVINEGANTGILITTSDYGHDSYEFAKDKPLKLLNGGHLLALLHKNGKKAHIDIEEAKKLNEK